MTNIDLQSVKKPYFLGIGGIGVSAIARMFIFKEGDKEELTLKLGNLLMLNRDAKAEARRSLRAFAETHSLKRLTERLVEEMSWPPDSQNVRSLWGYRL